MIKVGKKTKAKYWGNLTVQKVVQLDKPVKCLSSEKGEVSFNPTIVKISWEQDPSDDKHDLWFPYWITIDGKEKYGQFAPMIGQKAFLELMMKAIDERYFDEEFLSKLHKKTSERLKNEI
jgi:hypothetical protein